MDHDQNDGAAECTETAVPDFSMDDATSGGFNAWFQSLPQEDDVIRFFDRKGFYTTHAGNALFIAQTFYKTMAVVKYYGSEGKRLSGAPQKGQTGLIASVALNRNLFETVIREVLLEGSEHRVEIYEGSGTSWRLTKTASPGRLGQLEGELFRGNNDNGSELPKVLAVTLTLVDGQRQVGLAYVDAAARRLGACQFFDDDQLCALETAIVQLGSRECVIQQEPSAPGSSATTGTASAADWQRLRELLSLCGVMATVRPKTMFAHKHLEADLAKLLKSGSTERHADVLERPAACSALAAALAYSELLADSTNHSKFDLALYDPGRYMRLDSAAQKALNVTPVRQDSNSSHSLLGLLGRTRTAMGKRRLRTWLKQPLMDIGEIGVRLDVVEAMVQDAEMRERLRDQHLRGMPDIERLCRRLEARRLGLPELCLMYRVSAVLPLIEDVLRCYQGPHANLLITRFADMLKVAHDSEHLSKFEELLEAAVDLEAVPEEYLICATYDPRLQTLKSQKKQIEAEVDRLALEAARDLGLELGKTLKLEWHKFSHSRSRCLRITQKEEKVVRPKLNAKYKTIESRKDGTKFTNRQIESAAERLSTVSSQYEDLQTELVEQVVSVAHTFVEVWDTVSNLLAELDVLLGFADLSVSAPSRYVRPTILPADAGEITLVGCRHPCVEVQDGMEFIKNDCSMIEGESWFQVITGPNMGGKSTFIRQVGVCILMAQIGCFVPCDSARISVRDAIFARVGAGDCQQKGVSTFMAEMLETAAILKGASERSLVIIDELGRGTSTYDGFGIAWAIAEQIMEDVGAPTLFATHFHELKELSGVGGVRNLHVAAAVDAASKRLTMLYQIRPGPCDQSFGIQVAESANFPPSVVNLAKSKLLELESGEAGLQAAGAKRKMLQHDEEGVRRAKSFLKGVSSLPIEGMSDDESICKIKALLTGLENTVEGTPNSMRLIEA